MEEIKDTEGIIRSFAAQQERGAEESPFKDNYGRKISYLRLSVTDRCNLRCLYCWTCEGIQFIPHQKIMRYEEILQILDILVNLGVTKLRLTGGEPFARKGLLFLLEEIVKRYPQLALHITTNATLLGGKVQALKDLGVRCLNISLDTFSAEKFERISGRNMHPAIMKNIHDVLDAGIGVKLNAVALRGYNDDELPQFLGFARDNGVHVRFIEFMPMGGKTRWSQSSFWAAQDIVAEASCYAKLEAIKYDMKNSGPARLYQIDDSQGKFGIITPISNHFCNTCNRLRITPDGHLRTCLFSDKEYRLRQILRHEKLSTEQKNEFIKQIILQANTHKPLGYTMLEHKHSDGSVAFKHMSAIGG